jgi:hypothetical protein
MRKLLSLSLVFLLTTLSLASPKSNRLLVEQEPAKVSATELTNQDVLDMVKAGLADEIIIAKINSSLTKFDTTPATLTSLKSLGVSDAVIMAMVRGSEKPSVPAPAINVEVKVPDGTEIEVQLQNTLSGQEAKIGDIVDFTVLRPVQVNGIIVFEAGASGRARVTTAKKTGHWGKAGKLEWAMQDIQASDGKRIPVRFTKRQLGDSKGGTVAVAAVATTVFLGPFGLLWGLKQGKPAIIPAGNVYSVFVHGDANIKGKPVIAARTN